MSRTEHFEDAATAHHHPLHGAGSIEAMFPEGRLTAGVPWPAASRSKLHQDYDKSLVHAELSRPVSGPEGLKEIDPQTLHATQPKVTRGGVSHYLEGDYEKSGQTFADRGNVGNQFPFVYTRTHSVTGHVQNIILSGHHRAAAALLRGKPLLARHVFGPEGPAR